MILTPISRAENMRGASLMMASMAAFTFNDACLKYAASELPLFQTVFLRGLLVTGLLLLLAWHQNALRPIPPGEWPKVALRALAELCAFLPFVIALTHMPLANLTAILQVLPLTLTLAGAVFLRESVGWRRWSAILVGFFGVLLIVQPGMAGFNGYALLGLLAVVAVTLRDIITRGLAPEVPSLLVSVVTAASICTLGAVGSLFETWSPVTPMQGSVIAWASIFILGGYLFSVMVMRVGEIGFVTPFRYTALIWGLLLGWLVFGEWPNTLALLGGGIVAATGIYTLWRERLQNES